MRQVILLAVLALFIPVALAVSLQSPADSYVSSNSSVAFTFTSEANSSECRLSMPAGYVQAITGILEGQQRTFNETLADGNYTWQVNCTSETSPARKLVVDTSAPSLSIAEKTSPINYSKIQFNFTPGDTNIAECSLYADISGWAVRKTIPAASGLLQNITYAVPDGTYTWGIVCTDIAQNHAAANSTITIDTTAPEISLTSPSGFFNTATASLALTTSEPASCRFSPTANLSYEAMQQFEITGNTAHKNFLSGLSDGIHHYYIACADNLLNRASHKATFEVNTPPTAKINIDAQSPLRAGTYKLRLETSKTLASPPTLSYSFDDGQKTVPIFLSGSGNLWEGTMILDDSNKKLVGGFSFVGTDLRGTAGTAVSDGKFFLVDTIEPAAPDSLKAEPEGLGIRLKWHSGNDDVATFAIYRGASSGIGYAEQYDSTNGTSYLDRSASSQVTYYYKVAAVDKAGNLGALSPEVYATSLSLNTEPSPIPEKKMLPPALVPKVDNELYRVAKLTLDVNEALLSMQESSDPQAIELAAQLGAAKKIEDAKASLNKLQERLEGMKSQYMPETELAYELGKAELEIKKLEKSTIQSITVADKVTFEQQLTPEDISQGADELIASLGLNPAMKDDYVSGLDINLFSISGKAVVATIRYLNLSEEEKTIVTKKISVRGGESLEDVIIVEIIPKEFADSAKKITFISEQPEVLREDPVVKYGYSRFKEVEISYSVHGNAAQAAKKIKSAPLTQLRKLDSTGDKSPTGLAVLSSFPQAIRGNLAVSAGMLIIILLLGYYLIFLEGVPRIIARAPRQEPAPAKKEQELELMKGNIDVIKAELSERIYPTLSSIQQAMEQQRKEAMEAAANEKTAQEKKEREQKSGEMPDNRSPDKTPENDIMAQQQYALLYEIKMLIEEAKTHLDYGKQEKAAALYPKIMQHYAQLPANGKKALYSECINIHRSITRK